MQRDEDRNDPKQNDAMCNVHGDGWRRSSHQHIPAAPDAPLADGARSYGTAFPLLAPHRTDHIEAAALRNLCRKKGVQIGTIDALLARLCIQHKLTMLTTDEDFSHVAKLTALSLWRG